MINIYPVNLSDIPNIDKLGTNSYPDNYYEGIESFASKIRYNLSTCWIAKDNTNLVGYIISFPYILGQPYPINQLYQKIENPTCLYIHDLCIDEKYRGLGLGKQLVEKIILNTADDISLVSVLNSQPFWQKMGFISVYNLNYCGLLSNYMLKTCNNINLEQHNCVKLIKLEHN